MVNWVSNPEWSEADSEIPSALLVLVERQFPHISNVLFELFALSTVTLLQYATTTDRAGIQEAMMHFQRTKFMLGKIANRREDFRVWVEAFSTAVGQNGDAIFKERPDAVAFVFEILEEMKS